MSEHGVAHTSYDGSKYKIAVVVSLFNGDITEHLKKTFLDTMSGNYQNETIDIYEIAGAADAPAVLATLGESGKYDGLALLGSVIKGETAHFSYVNKLATNGVRETQMKYALPIAFGVLMCDTHEQAVARQHLGAEYAHALMKTIQTVETIKKLS